MKSTFHDRLVYIVRTVEGMEILCSEGNPCRDNGHLAAFITNTQITVTPQPTIHDPIHMTHKI